MALRLLFLMGLKAWIDGSSMVRRRTGRDGTGLSLLLFERAFARSEEEVVVQIRCPFYEHVHVGETWDLTDEAIMACRDRQRTEVGDSLPDEQRTQTTEMCVADSATLIMPCLFCGAVTLLEDGMCEKCADEGKSRVY